MSETSWRWLVLAGLFAIGGNTFDSEFSAVCFWIMSLLCFWASLLSEMISRSKND